MSCWTQVSVVMLILYLLGNACPQNGNRRGVSARLRKLFLCSAAKKPSATIQSKFSLDTHSKAHITLSPHCSDANYRSESLCISLPYFHPALPLPILSCSHSVFPLIEAPGYAWTWCAATLTDSPVYIIQFGFGSYLSRLLISSVSLSRCLCF